MGTFKLQISVKKKDKKTHTENTIKHLEYSYQIGKEADEGGGAFVRFRTQRLFVFLFFNLSNSNGAYVWVCVSVLFPRIGPVGEPYR